MDGTRKRFFVAASPAVPRYGLRARRAVTIRFKVRAAPGRTVVRKVNEVHLDIITK